MRTGVVVVGGGGHAKVCIELLQRMGETVDWCVANGDGPDLCLGVPVLKGDENLVSLSRQGYSRAFVALGSNNVRVKLADQVRDAGFSLVRAIAPSAIISPSVNIGEGVAIMEGVVVNAACDIQPLAIVNTSASVDHDCTVGMGSHVAPNCGLAGNVRVGHRAFLGVGSSVIPDIEIGDDAIVGAGSVVIRDVPAGATVVGVPARSGRQAR